jgi:SsrA-binding protein
MAKEKTQNKIHIRNKRVSFEYFVIDSYLSGIVLTGTEIKSIREGKASLADSYCVFKNNELFVVGMHIAEYALGTYNNHDPKRERKLLLTRRELNKLKTKSNEKGFTIVPTDLFINDKGLAKVNIALAKGKHFYDKRENLKDEDNKKEIERAKYKY